MTEHEGNINVSGDFNVSIPGECLRRSEEEKRCQQTCTAPPADQVPEKRSKRHNKDLGKRGEEAAARFLERRGYEILERNWFCDAGEADIVCRDDSNLVFVEVKTRMDEDRGLPEEAVGQQKRHRYERIAASYLRFHDTEEIQVRFDVIAILVLGNDRALIRHHINAFGAC